MRRFTRSLVARLVLLVVCGCGLAAFSQQSPPLREVRLDMLVSSSIFRTANRNDATVAIRVWGKVLGRRKGFEVEPTVKVVDDVEEIRKQVLTGEGSLIAVDAFEYLKLADLPTVEPVFAAQRGRQDSVQRYVLLVR